MESEDHAQKDVPGKSQWLGYISIGSDVRLQGSATGIDGVFFVRATVWPNSPRTNASSERKMDGKRNTRSDEHVPIRAGIEKQARGDL